DDGDPRMRLRARVAALERAGVIGARSARGWGQAWLLRATLAEPPGDERTGRVRAILAGLTGGDPDGWRRLGHAELLDLRGRLGTELARRGMLAGVHAPRRCSRILSIGQPVRSANRRAYVRPGEEPPTS